MSELVCLAFKDSSTADRELIELRAMDFSTIMGFLTISSRPSETLSYRVPQRSSC